MATPRDAGEKIWVGIARSGDGNILISVRDEGSGLPEDFDPNKSRGLGMRIVKAFANQLNTNVIYPPIARFGIYVTVSSRYRSALNSHRIADQRRG